MEPMRVLKYDGKGATVAIVELDIEALVDSLVDEVEDCLYDRSVAKVTLANGRRKEIRWSRKPKLYVLNPELAVEGLPVGEFVGSDL